MSIYTIAWLLAFVKAEESSVLDGATVSGVDLVAFPTTDGSDLINNSFKSYVFS